jgi:hypothetical protein
MRSATPPTVAVMPAQPQRENLRRALAMPRRVKGHHRGRAAAIRAAQEQLRAAEDAYRRGGSALPSAPDEGVSR